MKKPKINLEIAGKAGNAFIILGMAQRLIKEAYGPVTKDKFVKEATSKDYKHLLKTVEEYCDVKYA